MEILLRQELDGRIATIAHSTRVDGDLSPSQVPLEVLQARRQAAVPHAWQVVHQVHSDRVVRATHARVDDARPIADALVTNEVDLAIAVHSGDCVPVGFIHPAGAVGAAHAGWKGLAAGVLESTVRELSATHSTTAPLTAVVGPHIRVDRYEFGANDLDKLARRFGDSARGVTEQGTPGLDLTAAIASELQRLGVNVAVWSPDCTSANETKYWSHRARQEAGRIALVAWMEAS